MQEHVYKSKCDRWLIAVLLISPLILLYALIEVTQRGQVPAIIIVSLALLMNLGIYAFFIYPLYYRLDSDHLLIRYGICRKRIPYDQIMSAYPSMNPINSPALSLDRLAITYGQAEDLILISPKQRDSFLAELAIRANLIQQNDSWVKVSEPT